MQKKRGWSCILIIILLLVLGGCLTSGISLIGINEYKDLPRLVSGFNFGRVAQARYTYSEDQQIVLDKMGTPESFTILFYQSENAQGKVETIRYEEWQYPTAGYSVKFENGVHLSDAPIDLAPVTGTSYSPDAFTAFIDREQVATAVDLEEWFILPVEKELMQDADLYYATGLMFGLQNGELIYVETVPFEDENASVMEPPTETTLLALTPEETANQGTHTYDVTFMDGDEIIEEHSTTVTITFFEGGCILGENVSATTFTQIATNQYQEDADDPLLMIFSPDGFSWTFSDSQYETIFVFQE